MRVIEEYVYKCCFTGYRPSKMPFCHNTKGAEYVRFENLLLSKLTLLIKEGCQTFYTGMAMGFDIIAAETVLMLKKLYTDKDLKLIAVIPFKGQENSFSEEWKTRYYNVLEQCDECITLSDRYYSGCYQARNTYMVNSSDYVLTWFDGKAGGTKNTIDYAKKKQRKVFNINEAQRQFFAEQTQMLL